MMPLFGGLFLITSNFLLVQHASAVTELTDANFYDYAKDKDVLLVDFFAPWCSDCKALDPDFENAATNLGTRSVDLAKVDCFGSGKGLCATYGVKRWPTLKNFNRGQYTGDYTGGLTSAEIAGYISTVENSVHPVVNPYAAPFNPQPAVVQTEQCVTKCKISRLSNKQRCFDGCKAKSYGKKVMLPQPVINEKSCAKCRQPQVAGKYSKRKSSRKRRRNCRKNYAAKRADLLSAMDGRNAFVLAQKGNPQLNSPVKPAPAEEVEILNSTTLAKLPGGWKEIVKQENKTSTRDIETNQVPQRKPKTTSPIYKQFLQEEPMILRPSIFPIPELDTLTPINTTSEERSMCNTTEMQKVGEEKKDSSDACGYSEQNIDPLKEELKKISHDLLHSRVSEVINHGKEVELITSASARNLTGQINKSMAAHELQNTKILKHKPLKHFGDDKNAVVLLNILTPEEAIRLPYLVNDKKKNVPKLKKISNE